MDRRARASHDRIRIPYGGEPKAAVEVVDLFDFGVPVDVEAPPANEVVSEEEFDKLMEKECAEHCEDPKTPCAGYSAPERRRSGQCGLTD